MLFAVLNVNVSPLALGLLLHNQGKVIPDLINKHQSGHWGSVDPSVIARNWSALASGSGVVISIHTYMGTAIEIRSTTRSGFSLSSEIRIAGELNTNEQNWTNTP